MHPKTDRRHGCPVGLILIVLLVGVGCLAATVLAINISPRLLAKLLSLEPLELGPRFLSQQPAPLTLDGERLDHVKVLLSPRAPEPLTLSSSDAAKGSLPGDPLIGDASSPGTTTYLLSVDETSLNGLLHHHGLLEGPENDRYRNLRIDLQPGGLIVSAEVDLGIRRQRVGLLLLQDEEALKLSPAGVMLDGSLYSMPESGSLARSLLPAGRQVQRALDALTIVGPLPGEAQVDLARFHDDHLQILAQATYAVSTPSDTGWRLLERGIELREMEIAADAEHAIERVSMVRLRPAELTLRVYYDPDNPKRISTWAAALDAFLVVNGSYFAPDSEEGNETIGLLVSDGQRWGTPLHNYAGMLAVTADGQVSVRWLRHQPYDPQEPLTQAMQSFPMLVKPGGAIGFPVEADDGTPARRTAVAQDADGNLLLIVAPRGTLSLHELAAFLTDSDLAIDVALNLDGGGSSGMWLLTSDAHVEIDSYAAVPSVIAVEKP